MTEPLPYLSTAPHADLETLSAADRPSSLPSSVLHDEIRILRDRGFSDDCIHTLLRGFHIDVRPERLADHSRLALSDQLVRLIWGASAPRSAHAD